MVNEGEPKPIKFHPAAEKAMREFGKSVRDTFEDGLYIVTLGEEPGMAGKAEGFPGRQVLKFRANDRNGTYRLVYTVRFAERVYVLHAFQKKAHKGKATDKADLELVKTRLKWAESEHSTWLKEHTKKKGKDSP
jgi:phage-related protein